MLRARAPLHQDSQNVHRREVFQVHKPILDWLLKTIPEPFGIEETLCRIHCGLLQILKRSRRRTWASWFRTQFGIPDPRVMALMANLKCQTAQADILYSVNGMKVNFSLLLRLVTTKVWEIKNSDLSKCFLLELCDGMGLCLPGQAARLLNTFCGFEVAPISDPRSVAERVGDEIAVIAHLTDPQTKIQKAKEILQANGLPQEEWAPWLAALQT
jgi:hypothetical protein